MRRSVVALVIAWSVAVTSGSEAQANHLTKDDVVALATERAEAWGARPSRVLAIIRCETGNTWRSDLIGKAGEVGRAQWLARGAWYGTRHYTEWGIDIRAMYHAGDPDAEFWDIDGLAHAQARPDLAYQWSC